MKQVKRNPRRSTRKTASQLSILKSSMHKIFKNGLRLSTYNKQSRKVSFSSFQVKRHDRAIRILAGLVSWSMQSASTMSSSGPTKRSSHWRHLPTRRMIDCMYVMQVICLKVIVPIYAVWNQLEWWCGQQSLLMDPSPLRLSSRRVSRWTRKFTSKFWQKTCYSWSLEVLENVIS